MTSGGRSFREGRPTCAGESSVWQPEIERKFHQLADPVIDAERAARIARALGYLFTARDLSELMEALSTSKEFQPN